jgi:hypothetical protein
MITEDFVSFEVAKLLKERGFNADINLWYDKDGNIFDCYKYEISRNWRVKAQQEVYFCPTLQMAMKWLRKVYNFHIWVEPNHDKEGLYNAHVKVGWWSNNWGGVGYNTYEQACEAAIKYCLEHLI